MKIKLLTLFISGALTFGFGQTDEDVLKTIYTTSLTNGHSYQWLDYLSNTIGGRLSGSTNAELAVQYTKSELEKLGLDKVWLQPVMVPKWVRCSEVTLWMRHHDIDPPICRAQSCDPAWGAIRIKRKAFCRVAIIIHISKGPLTGPFQAVQIALPTKFRAALPMRNNHRHPGPLHAIE